MTLGQVIDLYIQDMKMKGVSYNTSVYSDFLNVKAKLLELKAMFGYCSTNTSTLEAVKNEYFKEYSPYAPSINTRNDIWNRLIKFISENLLIK